VITPTSMLPQTAPSSGATATTSNGLPTSQGLDTMFLQLLVAQLQNQDPTSPLDPSQFVSQLAQFSELSEVTQIDQLLQQVAGSGSSTTGGSSPTGGSRNPANPLSATAPSPILSSPLSSAVSAAQSAVSNFVPPAESFLKHAIQGVF